MFSTFLYENGEDISLYIVVTIDGFTNHNKSVKKRANFESSSIEITCKLNFH